MSEQKFPKWLETFIPTKEVAFTPVVISLNVLVWLIMIATGVDALTPTTEDAFAWGACSREGVLAGDYWRLWTSNYLHYGIIHLAVNMISLNNVGRLLERFIGTWRFALLYTATGIFASSVSIWWNPFAVGVGASGAILGIVGVLTGLCTTNLIDKKIRWQMLRSIGTSILLMLALGFMVKGVDNAAHIGGLISGAIGGYFIYPELKAFYYDRKKQYWGLIGAVFLILGGAGWMVMQCKPVSSPNDLFSDAKRSQKKADSLYMENNDPDVIDNKVFPAYNLALLKLDSLPFEDLDSLSQQQVSQYRAFLNARMEYYASIRMLHLSGDSLYHDSIYYWDSLSRKIEPIIFDTQE